MQKARTQRQGVITEAAAIERRAWVRYASNWEASCQGKGSLKDAGWPGKVLDISIGGVGFILRHRFPPGAPLTVEVKNPRGKFPPPFSGRVLPSRPRPVPSRPPR